MRYMVKCAYCGKTYIVDSEILESDFSCKSCGAQNGKEDIIEEIVPVKRYVERGPKERDPLKTIKNFDISQYETDGDLFALDHYNENRRSSGFIPLKELIPLFVIILAIVLYYLCAKFFL